MRALFWLIAVFAAAAALAIVGRSQESYALFVLPPWRVEISLLLFALGSLAAFALAYGVVRLVHHTLALPAHVRAYRERRGRDRAQSAMALALQAVFEGRYARAEKEARLAWEGGHSKAIAALIGARAAQGLGEAARRDQWLERAAEDGDRAKAARLITEAELALEERDFLRARKALRELHDSGPRHIAALRMLLRAERGVQNWEEVSRLAGLLAKRHAIAPAAASEHQAQAAVELLARTAGDARSFEYQWRKVDHAVKLLPRVALAGARQATALGLDPLARDIVERSLANEWDGALVLQYSETSDSAEARAREVRSRIERAERWLTEHAEDTQLLLTLGQLCAQAELWGQAQRYLEASLAFAPSKAAHLAFARLLERAGRVEEAAAQYRKAAGLQ